MKLYLRFFGDEPHRRNPATGNASCGVNLRGSKEITDKQALVWLGNRRCHGCFPFHSATEGQKRRG